MNPDTSITDFDNLTFSHPLQMLKAALPYMAVSQQKTCSIFIKLFELRSALGLLEEENNQLSACSNEEEPSTLDMLTHIRDYCNEKERELIDLFINFSQAFQLYSSYRSTMPEGNQDSNPFDMLKALLTPEQQAMYNSYSKMFAAGENNTAAASNT